LFEWFCSRSPKPTIGSDMMKTRRCRRSQMLIALFCGSVMGLCSVPPVHADSPWVSTAQSTGHRPIQVARFGKGPQNVLVVGSLSGNDPETLALMDAACKISSQYPPPEPITLLFVRTLNPDGAADLVHTNSHGVELNRNFPSPYFTSIPNRLTGPAPASEVETQYMLRILEEYKPVRVIHVRGGVGESPLVIVNELWMTLGEKPTLPEHVHLGFFEHSYKAGSLEEYATRMLNASVSTIHLAATGARQLDPGELLRFATGQLSSTNPPASLARQGNSPSMTQKTTPVATIPESEAVSPPAGKAPSSPHSANQNATRGEVEFLPTPPEFMTTGRTGGSTTDQSDGRYFELPPPSH